MKRLYNFSRLSRSDRRLLAKSTFLIGGIRFGLWLLPFKKLLFFLTKMARRNVELSKGSQAFINKVVWAVTVGSRYVPKATCLTQALATYILLAQYGYHARLRIGVARSEEGQFRAHAWVETQEKVVIGGSESPLRYIPLLDLGEREQ